MAQLSGPGSVLGGVNVSPFGDAFPAPVVAKRSPSSSDTGSLGQLWINAITQQAYVLVYTAINNAVWLQMQSTQNGGFPWQIATVDTPLVAGNGYISKPASGFLNFLLPAVAAVGDTYRVTTYDFANVGGWHITQNAGQQIIFESIKSTVGVTGYLYSPSEAESIAAELVCIEANTLFTVVSNTGIPITN